MTKYFYTLSMCWYDCRRSLEALVNGGLNTHITYITKKIDK